MLLENIFSKRNFDWVL